MKTTLTSLITATLLGIASFVSGRPFDIADFTVILFATGLVAWTVEQYSRVPRALMRNRPIHLSLSQRLQPSVVTSHRLAA